MTCSVKVCLQGALLTASIRGCDVIIDRRLDWVDKLDEADSQRKTEEEVTEPQPIVFGQQLMLPPSPAPAAPQPAYPGYGYPAAPAGFPAQPAYGFNM
ncbi:Clathrin heavy chain 1 [Liparis tanakae]|uniref:Clathrin heavy chain 1 n=1 Tax=Liparis tanakae TaxID=230148 RepID=A0A4Z2E4T7_9TELE|nr:Clathrin heavy chain 1 [Liparis tanakae]